MTRFPAYFTYSLHLLDIFTIFQMTIIYHKHFIVIINRFWATSADWLILGPHSPTARRCMPSITSVYVVKKQKQKRKKTKWCWAVFTRFTICEWRCCPVAIAGHIYDKQGFPPRKLRRQKETKTKNKKKQNYKLRAQNGTSETSPTVKPEL